MMPVTRQILLPVLLMMTGISVSLSQQTPRTESADSIQRWIEPSTVAVARLQTSDINADALVQWMNQLQIARDPDTGIAALSENLRLRLKLLGKVGVDELFVTVSTGDLTPFSPVLLCRPADASLAGPILADIINTFAEGAGAVSRSDRGWMIAGRPKAVDRILSNSEPMPSRFSEIFDRDTEPTLDHQVVLAPPEIARQVAAAFSSTQPPRGMQLMMSPRETILEFESASLRFSLPPATSASLSVTVIDASAAERMAQWIEAPAVLPALVGEDYQLTRTGATIEIKTDQGQTDRVMQTLVVMIGEELRRLATMNLRQAGLAMHNHHSAFKQFPEAILEDAKGNPLLSWRIKLTPFLEEMALWNSIDRGLPWDDPANVPAQRWMPPAFETAGDPAGMTRLRIPVVKGSYWADPAKPKRFQQILDGTSHTVMFAVAPPDKAVPWMKPELWKLDDENLKESFFGERDSAQVVFFDGSIHRLEKDKTSEAFLRAILTHQGKEPINVRRN